MNDTDAAKFLDLLESMGMTQHVNAPTHRAGHTLDLMITREFDCMIHSEPSSDIFYSDHCMVLAELSLQKPALTVREVSCRKMKAVDRELFRRNLRAFIEENSTDQRRLFKATSALLGNSSGERYPPYEDLSGLANDF